jgi:hypothetical protein
VVLAAAHSVSQLALVVTPHEANVAQTAVQSA